MANLTAKEIVKFVRNSGKIKLVSAVTSDNHSKIRYDIVDAEYNAPMIKFKQSNNGDIITIDKRNIFMSYRVGTEIHLLVGGEYGPQRLCSNYDEAEEFDFRPSGNEPLKPHEIRACDMRAAELESYVNHELGFDENSKLRVYIRLHSEQILGEGRNSSDGEQSCTYNYKFEMTIGSNDEQPVIYADGIFIDLAMYGSSHSLDIVKDLARALIGRLIPTAQSICES